jgi:hypothetical protein
MWIAWAMLNAATQSNQNEPPATVAGPLDQGSQIEYTTLKDRHKAEGGPFCRL